MRPFSTCRRQTTGVPCLLDVPQLSGDRVSRPPVQPSASEQMGLGLISCGPAVCRSSWKLAPTSPILVGTPCKRIPSALTRLASTIPAGPMTPPGCTASAGRSARQGMVSKPVVAHPPLFTHRTPCTLPSAAELCAGADSRQPFPLRLRGEIRCFLVSPALSVWRLRLSFPLGAFGSIPASLPSNLYEQDTRTHWTGISEDAYCVLGHHHLGMQRSPWQSGGQISPRATGD